MKEEYICVILDTLVGVICHILLKVCFNEVFGNKPFVNIEQGCFPDDSSFLIDLFPLV